MVRNTLYLIFLKSSNLNFLIIGEGNLALDKLTFQLKSSPNENVQVVSQILIKRKLWVFKKKLNSYVYLLLFITLTLYKLDN